MISAVTSAAHFNPTSEGASPAQASKSVTPNPSAAPSKTQSTPSPVADSVQISSAAQAALKETLETPAQTAKEALGGDRQAQSLLAKEQAASKS